MDMKGFVNNLTAEQRERLKSCHGSEDIIAFAKRENLALPDEYLSRVAGGTIGEIDPAYQPGEPLCDICYNSDLNKMILLDKNLYFCQVCGAVFSN